MDEQDSVRRGIHSEPFEAPTSLEVSVTTAEHPQPRNLVFGAVLVCAASLLALPHYLRRPDN